MPELSRETILDTFRDISASQQATLTFCSQSLDKIKEGKKITENTYKELSNIISELTSLRELFITRLFHSLKRGDML